MGVAIDDVTVRHKNNMAASRFLRRYERFCEEDGGVEPLQGVITACKHKHTTLDLSGVCLSREMCSIIERTLKKGHPFTELTFADCLVGDEGSICVLWGCLTF